VKTTELEVEIESPPVIEVAGSLSRIAAAGHVQPSASRVGSITKYVTVATNDSPAGLSIELAGHTTSDRSLNDVIRRADWPNGLLLCTQRDTELSMTTILIDRRGSLPLPAAIFSV